MVCVTITPKWILMIQQKIQKSIEFQERKITIALAFLYLLHACTHIHTHTHMSTHVMDTHTHTHDIHTHHTRAHTHVTDTHTHRTLLLVRGNQVSTLLLSQEKKSVIATI